MIVRKNINTFVLSPSVIEALRGWNTRDSLSSFWRYVDENIHFFGDDLCLSLHFFGDRLAYFLHFFGDNVLGDSCAGAINKHPS